MNSLPAIVERRLQGIVTLLNEGLQERVHGVHEARRADRAFRRPFTASPLLRALLCDILGDVQSSTIRVDELGNGGCEVVMHDADIERRFRLKLAARDQYGRLVVTASSDSILAVAPRLPELFDPPELKSPSSIEQWVLAYRLHGDTSTFVEVSAGRVVGKANERPPYRLLLDDLVSFAIHPPIPPSFRGSEDDLDLGEEEGFGTEGAI